MACSAAVGLAGLGSTLCQAEDLGSVASSTKQGPHLPWQLMSPSVFGMYTLLATGGDDSHLYLYLTANLLRPLGS